MSARPEIFISATSKDLGSCRQLVRDALLTLGCVPVVQDHFPPGAGEVRAMLRERIAGCQAVIHLAGECYGFEPQERGPTEPRRSYTQLEYDIARELKKPLYTFLCAPAFPYDAHAPEPEELRLLQEQHRTALAAGDNLYVPLKDTTELSLRVRELQTRVETLSKDLQKTRSWLGRGLVAALVSLGVIGTALVFQHQRTRRTEARAAHSEQQIAQLGSEMDRYRQAVKLLADRYGQDSTGGKLTPQQKLDRALASVAEEQKVSVAELKTWLDLFVTQVRTNPGADFYDRALADFAEQHFADAVDNAKKSAEQFRTQRQAAEQVQETAAERVAQARDKERQSWALAGDAEFAAGHYAPAIELFDQALALFNVDKEPLAWCDVAQKREQALNAQGRYPEAAALAQLLVEKRTALLGKEHPDTLRSIYAQAIVYLAMGNFTAAEPLFRRCLEARERVLGKEHPDTLRTAQSLANLLLQGKGDLAGAEALYRHDLEVQERTVGEENADTLNSLNNLSNVLYAKGDYAGAEALALHTLEGRERVLGKDHPLTLVAVSNLAVMHSMRGDNDGAEQLFRRALEAQERSLGPDHPDTLRSLNNLAFVLEKKGGYVAAEPLCRRCLEARERVLGPEHPDTLSSLNNLARILQDKGDLTSAEPLYRQALEAQERIIGAMNPDTIETTLNLTSLLRSKEDLAGAEALYRQALEAQEHTLGKENPDTLSSVSRLAQLLAARGDDAAAEPLYLRAEAGMDHTLPPDNASRLDLDYHFSLLRQKQGRPDEALPLAEHAVAGAAKTYPADNPVRLQYEKNLADLRARLANASPRPGDVR